MRAWKLIFKTLLLIASIISFVESALSVKELQNGISNEDPIFHVPHDMALHQVLSSPKDYNMIVLVTSLTKEYNCLLCEQFDPIFVNIVTLIYRKFPALRDRLFFIHIEAAVHLDELKDLGIQSIPQVWGFPDTKRFLGEQYNEIIDLLNARDNGKYVDTSIDLDQIGMEHYTFEMVKGEPWDLIIEKFGKFVSHVMEIDVSEAIAESKKEGKIDWFVTLQWFFYIFISIKVLQNIRSAQVPIFKDKKFYLFIVLLMIYFNLSGFNFTIQRNSPFISQKDGQILWIAPQSNIQFGSEVGISIILQSCFSIMLIFMIDYVKLLKGNHRDYLLIFCSLLMIVLLSFGTNIYHYKNSSYPFNFIHIL